MTTGVSMTKAGKFVHLDKSFGGGGGGALGEFRDPLEAGDPGATVVDAVDQVPLGIMPAGAANLVAKRLHIAVDLEAAVNTALRSEALPTDVGR